MATLPNAITTVDTSGPISVEDDQFLVLFTAGKGTHDPRAWGNVASFLAEHGDCAAASFFAHYVRFTRKTIVGVRLPTVTAGAVAQLNKDGVTGSSVISVAASGDGIHDDFECILEVLETGVADEDPGTIGVSGIVVRVTLDGGRSWSKHALGTANSLVIARTGQTVSFGAGTLAVGDRVTWHTVGSAGDSDGIEAALIAIRAQPRLFRGGIVLFPIDATVASDTQGFLVDLDDFGRPQWLTLLVRDWYHDALMSGKPADVDFAASGHTITRGTGSWVTDGFKVGMTATISGSVSNNFTAKLTGVSATVLTFASGVVNEANVDGAILTITAEELEADWMASVDAAFVAKVYDNPRIGLEVGMMWARDPLLKHHGRRPFGWRDAIRDMQYGPQINAAKVETGALEWTLTDEQGNTIEHDENLNPGLTAAGFSAARSYNTERGAFCALPLLRCTNVDGALSRRPIRSVVDIACVVSTRETTRKLMRELLLNADGTIEESEAKLVEGAVNSALARAMQTPPDVMVSAISWTMDRTTDYRVPGAPTLGDLDIEALGYHEQFRTTARLSAPTET